MIKLFARDAWPEGERLLPAARRVPVPAAPRRIARRLFLAIVGFLFFGAIAPWQQNISGAGQVVAFAPDQRPQPIQATISGLVTRWHVIEGQAVEEGDVLVELSDNDPDRLTRLTSQVEAAESRLEAYQSAVGAYQERLDALERSQRAQIDAAQQEVTIAQQTLNAQREALAAAEVNQRTAELQQNRIRRLTEQGLSSQRDQELAELGATNSNASLVTAQARLRSATASLASKRASLERARASTEADIRSATASLRSAETEVASAEASLLSAESSLAQQAAQIMRAPRAGTVQRVSVQQGVQVRVARHWR